MVQQAPGLTDWQKRARTRLREIVSTHPELTVHYPLRRDGENLVVDITLELTGLGGAPGGLPLNDTERFTISIPSHHFTPPRVTVNHIRFLGYPHVLAGHVLCLYLDPSREWDFTQGITGLLNQLWQWLHNAANNAFDADTALYHAVGGYTHIDAGTPVIVIRNSLLPRRASHDGYLEERTPRRHDHHPGAAPTTTAPRMPVYLLRHDLPFGAGTERLVDLLERIDEADTQYIPVGLIRPLEHRLRFRLSTVAACAIATRTTCTNLPRGMPNWDPPLREEPAAPSTANGLLTVLAASAMRQPAGTPQYLLLGVPHPSGGPHHLLGLRLPIPVTDLLRRVAKARTTPTVNVKASDVADNIDMEWCYVSDERPAVTTRRDNTRPVNSLHGKTVHIWGCGGLGSWIAEFVVRAGAAEVTVCDPGMVTGGLLVRQNYDEHSVGDSKAESLARRLRAISDAAQIHHFRSQLPAGFEKAAYDSDLIIDATISHTIGTLLDHLGGLTERRATIAKVATDVRTGSLGLAVVASPTATGTSNDIDRAAGVHVLASSELEDYRTFWEEPATADEVTPTRGCSTPTFHGSSADMAAIAASLLSQIAASHAAAISGTHLLALPYAGVSPASHYIPHG